MTKKEFLKYLENDNLNPLIITEYLFEKYSGYSYTKDNSLFFQLLLFVVVLVLRFMRLLT